MEISSTIDWISVTQLTGKYQEPPYLKGTPFKNIEGRYGYKEGLQYINGVTVLKEPANPNMGVHIAYSAQALDKIRRGTDERCMPLMYHSELRHRFSRIDVALDMKGDDIPTIKELVQAHDNGDCDTKTRSRPKVISSGLDQPETMYIGSIKARKKLMRVYRKDIQLGNGYAGKWLRAELEMRGKNAMEMNKVLEHEEDMHNAIIGLIRGYADFPTVQSWVEAMQAKPIATPVEAHLRGKTEEWLLTQVAPSLARVIVENNSFSERFNAVLQLEVEKVQAMYDIASKNNR